MNSKARERKKELPCVLLDCKSFKETSSGIQRYQDVLFETKGKEFGSNFAMYCYLHGSAMCFKDNAQDYLLGFPGTYSLY